MDLEIIKPIADKTTKWSGGTTTEYLIYPSTSQFKARNFQFRISTATIDLPETIFTGINHYQRVFTLLAGEIKFNINESEEVWLKELDQLMFAGDDKIKAYGTGKALNVIYKANSKVKVTTLAIAGKTNVALKSMPNNHLLFYAHQADIHLTAALNSAIIPKGNLALVKNSNSIIASFSSANNSTLIKIEITANNL